MRQRVATNPIMPLRLFTVRNFWTGNIATALIYGALSLNGFALGVYLQQGAGLNRRPWRASRRFRSRSS